MKLYEGNPVLRDAISGKSTVAQSVLDLSKVNRGLGRFLPRRKDDGYNKRLREVGELIGDFESYKARGILAPDNPTTLAVYSSLGTYFALNIGNLIAKGAPIYSFSSIISTLVVGAILGLTKIRDEYTSHWAYYVDKRVGEFYPKSL